MTTRTPANSPCEKPLWLSDMFIPVAYQNERLGCLTIGISDISEETLIRHNNLIKQSIDCLVEKRRNEMLESGEMPPMCDLERFYRRFSAVISRYLSS